MQGNPSPLANRRVLVVEDETMVAMMLEDYLEELGCIVAGSAARLDKALEMARLLDIDLAVLDLNLAGEMSYPVAEILQARRVPLIFATGYGPSGLAGRFQGAPVLSKPYNMVQLETALLASKAV